MLAVAVLEFRVYVLQMHPEKRLFPMGSCSHPPFCRRAEPNKGTNAVGLPKYSALPHSPSPTLPLPVAELLWPEFVGTVTWHKSTDSLVTPDTQLLCCIRPLCFLPAGGSWSILHYRTAAEYQKVCDVIEGLEWNCGSVFLWNLIWPCHWNLANHSLSTQYMKKGQ